MPIYKNDLAGSIIKTVITSSNKYAPSIIVRFTDDSEQVFDGNMVPFFINKYTDYNNRGIPRTIGYELEEKLRNDFSFLF